MGCRYCTGWRLYPQSEVYQKECGPTVGRGHHAVTGQIVDAGVPGWLRPVVTVRNANGFVISTSRGRPVAGLREARQVGDEMMDAECRMRSLDGLRRRTHRRRK